MKTVFKTIAVILIIAAFIFQQIEINFLLNRNMKIEQALEFLLKIEYYREHGSQEPPQQPSKEKSVKKSHGLQISA